jgi:TonB family protein
MIRYFPSFKSDADSKIIKPNIVIELSDISPTRQIVSSKGKPVKPVIPIAGNIKEDLLYDDESILGAEFGLLPIPAPPPLGNKTKTEYHPPRLIVSKFPEYPKDLQQQGVSGIIILEVKVDVNGNVIDHKIKSNTTHNQILERLAVETVYKCRYMPAMENKKPAVAWTDHKFEFIDKQPN